MKHNTGLSLLRIWMCFEVVASHFFDAETALTGYLAPVGAFVARYRTMHVGVFMILAFLLTDMPRLASDTGKIKTRMYRLLYPHLFWAVAYFVIYWLGDRIKKGEPFEHGITDLFWQILFGHSINETLWFQFDLIVITVLFLVVFRVLKDRYAVIATVLLGVAAIWMQYSGINAHLFDGATWSFATRIGYFREGYVTVPVGRLAEMLPCAAIGLLVCATGMLKKIKKHNFLVFFGSVILLWLLQHQIPNHRPEGYGYSGWWAFSAAVALVCLFYVLPLDKLPGKVTSLINAGATYTMGIYYAHRLINTLLFKFRIYDLLHLQSGTLLRCTVAFVVTWVVIFIGSRLPFKWVKEACV